MNDFFGIPNGAPVDENTYYIQFEENIDGKEKDIDGEYEQYLDYCVRSPALAVWKAGTAEARVDRALGRDLVKGVERKFGYEGDKPNPAYDWPEWAWRRTIAKVAADGRAVVLRQGDRTEWDFDDGYI
ncbi:MAG: hypothetical protein LBG71_08225 [Clostridiales Family XIII bacterium]|jgi:hypothetical protein|nr:hypothetical protein [Clostridiales Family XIII bacterium]